MKREHRDIKLALDLRREVQNEKRLWIVTFNQLLLSITYKTLNLKLKKFHTPWRLK